MEKTVLVGDGDGGSDVTYLVVDAWNVTGKVIVSIALYRLNSDGGGSGNGGSTL